MKMVQSSQIVPSASRRPGATVDAVSEFKGLLRPFDNDARRAKLVRKLGAGITKGIRKMPNAATGHPSETFCINVFILAQGLGKVAMHWVSEGIPHGGVAVVRRAVELCGSNEFDVIITDGVHEGREFLRGFGHDASVFSKSIHRLRYIRHAGQTITVAVGTNDGVRRCGACHGVTV